MAVHISPVGGVLQDATLGQGIGLDWLKATLSGTFTVPDRAPPVLLLDPGGAARNVLLPAESDSKGKVYWIKNLDGGVNAITVQEDSGTTTIVTVNAGAQAMVFCDGTTWYQLA